MHLAARFLATALLALGAVASFAAGPPNIVLILADDLGYTDGGTFGSRYYETPNIDRLARQGMKFTNFHQNQNCAPSRAALMSGQYAARTGIYTVGNIGRAEWQSRPLRPVDNVKNLPLDRILLPQALKSAGYATAMFGKWHLGQHGNYLPGKRGFDEAIVSMGKHFDFETDPPVPYPKGQYLTDFLTDRAVDFIERNRERPFFLYLAEFAVHTPTVGKPELVEKFKAKPGVGGHDNPVYAAMIASLDISVGRVMAKLDELKLADNTVLIFMSDNGGLGGYTPERTVKREGDVTDNAPLRSGKGSLYEGGTRVPLIVRWPGVVKPDSVSAVPTINVDTYPTLVEMAGAKMPASQAFDGTSWVPILRGDPSAFKRDAIYQHFPGYLGAGRGRWRAMPVSVIQSGDWKLMEFLEDGQLELYNLRDDIGEKKNLAATMPDKAKELQSRLNAWRSAIKAPMPTPNDHITDAPVPRAKAGRKARDEASED